MIASLMSDSSTWSAKLMETSNKNITTNQALIITHKQKASSFQRIFERIITLESSLKQQEEEQSQMVVGIARAYTRIRIKHGKLK